MEDVLDEIVRKAISTKVLETLWNFMPMVNNARKHMDKVKPAETEKCPVSDIRWSFAWGDGDFEAVAIFQM